MRRFIENQEREILLIFISLLGITRWWIPDTRGEENMYALSHWALSYQYGLLRRGLVGTIVKLWTPMVSVLSVHVMALVIYGVFVLFLLTVFYSFLRSKEQEGRMFRLILLFIANPATVAMLARDLGRFDILLMMITFLCITLLSFNKYLWLIPLAMTTAMFIHESFLVLYAPTILSAAILVYFLNGRKTSLLAVISVSALAVLASFVILYRYGNPAMGYATFYRLMQSRADFGLTELSMRECYYRLSDHYRLASSSLYDSGSLANFVLALVMISPVFLILINLWSHAFEHADAQRMIFGLVALATMSGFILVPIATDYGRWTSAVVFCNSFVIGLFLSKGIIRIEDLSEYSGGAFKLLFVFIISVYLLFGPFHDWNPYPYRDQLFISSAAIIAALLFDIGFIWRWKALRRAAISDHL